jgi:hypothetical protein
MICSSSADRRRWTRARRARRPELVRQRFQAIAPEGADEDTPSTAPWSSQPQDVGQAIFHRAGLRS